MVRILNYSGFVKEASKLFKYKLGNGHYLPSSADREGNAALLIFDISSLEQGLTMRINNHKGAERFEYIPDSEIESIIEKRFAQRTQTRILIRWIKVLTQTNKLKNPQFLQ